MIKSALYDLFYLKVIVLFGFFINGNRIYSQDIILRKDGNRIEAKVIGVHETFIEYRLQSNDLNKSIKTSKVSKILYEDGNIEHFSRKNHKVYTATNEDILKYFNAKENPYSFKSGLFIGGSIGNSTFNLNVPKSEQYVALIFHLGSNWYFGQNQKWRPGIQLIWVRYGINFNTEDLKDVLYSPKTFSLCNIGMANDVKLRKNVNLEINASTGLCWKIDRDLMGFSPGISIIPEIKLRFKNFSFGADYQLYITKLESSLNNLTEVISINFGIKF